MNDNNNEVTVSVAAAATEDDDDDTTASEDSRSATIEATADVVATNNSLTLNSSPTAASTVNAVSTTTTTTVATTTPRSNIIAKRKSPPGTTTARQKKKTKASTKIKIGCRVYSTRKSLYHIVKDEQREAMKDFQDNYKVFGTVKSGNTNKGYLVEFDMFPSGNKIIQLTRKRLTTLAKDEEEVNNNTTINIETFANIENDDESEDEVAEIATGATKKKKKDPLKESFEKFAKLEKEILKTTTIYEMRYGEEVDQVVLWDILEDNKHIKTDDDPFNYPDQLHFKKELVFNENKYDNIFFEDFFPTVTGHGILLDEFHSDIRSPYHRTVTSSKFKFHDPDDDDPDWIVKQCYLLLIASVTEADVGVENLWKKGMSGGHHEYANFGQYIPMNMFKAFQSGAALMFCDKKWWYEDYRDRDWDIIMPCITSYNQKRKQLFNTVLLMLDESMSGWRPKTSKLGGLPNLTFEPRKPVPLGTQFKNGIECLAGTIVFQDILQAPEVQKRKEFFSVLDADEVTNVIQTTSLPGNPPIQAHTAEVLRQVAGAGVLPGGWTGGDAWFGSVMTCVEVMKQLEVHSSFIVKNNVLFYPMGALHTILKARHGDRPAGH